MKVLHVIPAVAPSYGGPSQAVLDMCRALIVEGVEAEIATTNSDGCKDLNVTLQQRIDHKGVPTYFFSRSLKTEYKFSLPFAQWLKRNLKNYNLLHIHSVFCYPTAIAAYYARKFGIPYIICPAGILENWPMHQHRFRKWLYLQLVEKKSLDGALAIHCTSEKEKNSIEQFDFKPPAVVIPLSVSVAFQYQAIEKGRFRKKFPQIGQRKLIVFLSRIHKKKGLELLIEALASLKKNQNNFFLVIAGSGNERYLKTLKDKIARYDLNSQILFTGHLGGEEKYALLRDADLFVLSSYQENFGIAVAEALQMGVPVIVSDQVALCKEIESSEAGMVVPCDSKRLALAVGQLLNDYEERVRMGKNGKQLAVEKFNSGQMANKLTVLYGSILKNKNVQPTNAES